MHINLFDIAAWPADCKCSLICLFLHLLTITHEHIQQLSICICIYIYCFACVRVCASAHFAIKSCFLLISHCFRNSTKPSWLAATASFYFLGCAGAPTTFKWLPEPINLGYCASWRLLVARRTHIHL